MIEDMGPPSLRANNRKKLLTRRSLLHFSIIPQQGTVEQQTTKIKSLQWGPIFRFPPIYQQPVPRPFSSVVDSEGQFLRFF